VSHADTLDGLLRLLARARRLLDEVADVSEPIAPIIRGRAEGLATEIAHTIGHLVTDIPEAPEVFALRDYLDELAELSESATRTPDGDAADRCVHGRCRIDSCLGCGRRYDQQHELVGPFRTESNADLWRAAP